MNDDLIRWLVGGFLGYLTAAIGWGIRVELALAGLRVSNEANKENLKAVLSEFKTVVTELSAMRQDFAGAKADISWIKGALAGKGKE